MWLVNTHTKRLEKFYSDPTESYATLSHTWGREEEELSFQDMQALDRCDVERRAKLDRSCEQACKDGINYIWIDTCCIDKSSAVELSEAINSMFRWYQNSKVCYAYLSDVKTGQRDGICQSRWFTRGWTLQELLAPRKVTFFDSTWAELGTKSTLSVIVDTVTGIPHHILTGIASLQTCSVAQRMSWASKRTTTRPEDLAYCLLGIFDVMITPIYGEGLERAFGRLQEAVMKKIADDSILAWSLDTTNEPEEELKTALSAMSGSVLAASPADFEQCGDIVQRPLSGFETHIRAFDIFGGTMPISISLSKPVLFMSNGSPRRGGSTHNNPSSYVVHGYLSCGSKSHPSLVAAIPLVSCHDERARAHSKQVFIRPHGLHTVYITKPQYIDPPETIWIRNDRPNDVEPSEDKSYWIYLPPKQYPWSAMLDEVYPPSCFERDMAMIKTPRQHEFAADTDETLFLARFSYTLETAGSFILALWFFRESVMGTKEPWPYLYFDDHSSPAPLSTIARLWRSLLFTSTHEIIPAQAPSVGLVASVAQDTIDRHPLWVVDLSSVPTSVPTGHSHLPDWPNISDQIALRTECCALVHCVFEGAKLSQKYRLTMSELVNSDAEIDRTKKELEWVNSKIARLKVRANGLQYRLDRQAAHRLSLHSINATLSSSIDTISAEITEAESSKYVKRLWPRTQKSSAGALKPLSVTEMITRVEHDGVMAHILNQDPFMLPDKLKGKAPKSLDLINGMTLLMYAAATGNPEMVYRVLKYDSDTLAQDSSGSTAQDWAERSGLSGFESMCADWESGDLEALERSVQAFRQRNSEVKRRPSLSLQPIPVYNSSLSTTLPASDSSLQSPTTPALAAPVSRPPSSSASRLSVHRLDPSQTSASVSRRDSWNSDPALELAEQNRMPRRKQGRTNLNNGGPGSSTLEELKPPEYPVKGGGGAWSKIKRSLHVGSGN